MKVNRNSVILLWAIAILAMAHVSRAQTIPGRWHKVALPQPAQIEGDKITGFSFIDSMNGICVSTKGSISSTSNGGGTWVLDTNLDNNYLNLSTVECTAPHCGISYGVEWTLYISPSGTRNQLPPEVGQVNYGAYLTLAEKMYDTSYGFRLVEFLSPEDANQYDDSVVIIETHDGWQSSTEYGSAYIVSPDSTYKESHSLPMSVGYIVDSNDVWTSEGRNLIWTGTTFYDEPKVILHTSNGGLIWHSFDAFDSARYKPWIRGFSVNPKTHEVFCMVNYSTIDYAYSSDYGTTWRLDSTFSGSTDYGATWREAPINDILGGMANPAPGILWATIGVPNGYSKKIGYSSDNGATWLIDSTTFIDDSLEEMHWLDARHGWIASWSHDSLFMWYYDADGNSGVAEHSSPNPNQFIVYPNPARNSITVNGAASGIVITDALGRTWNCPRDGNKLDVSQLPLGIYFVRNTLQHSRFAKE